MLGVDRAPFLAKTAMRRSWFVLMGTLFPALLGAQTGRGPYARFAVLRPHDGKTVDFEAGYIRHLTWHQQARDPWVWYGWTLWASERQRWFVYATFGHSAASLDSSVAPTDDERDNVLNVLPHADFMGNGLYEFLPSLSRGTGEPQPTPRLELTTIDLVAGAGAAFEKLLIAAQPTLATETLWFRLVAGGPTPRYVRLRPYSTLGALLGDRSEPALPNAVNPLISRLTVEILNFRPTLSLGVVR
jgi:hypothetical protein